MNEYDKISIAAEFIESAAGDIPGIGIVLGSGLGKFAELLENRITIPYSEIPGFKKVSVKGHKGNLVKGSSKGVPVIVLQGRYHFYEGHDIKDVVFPVRVLCRMGVKQIILTNAAGGINREFKPGDLMIIEDHINLMGVNPLHGENDERLGPRFPDMSEVYNKRTAGIISEAGNQLGISLKGGVYAGLRGPSYETPAEIKMLASIGADSVGMSTVPESIAARHMGVLVNGISCITNYAAGITDSPLDHKEVTETAERVHSDFIRLIEKVISGVNSK